MSDRHQAKYSPYVEKSSVISNDEIGESIDQRVQENEDEVVENRDVKINFWFKI